MTLNIHLPDRSALSPKITVFGVGGAGGNAVNNMIHSNLTGVSFVVANTDSQALEHSLSQKKIQLGIGLTKGLGAGSLPEVGKGAAEESINEIMEVIGDSNMLFITAGMGGGTGTGAAPVIARVAKENKILTVGVVTKPFHFEGAHRMRIAELGLEELQKHVDTLIIIPNQNLFRIANEKTTFADAFKLADNVLHTGVRGITDLMVLPGLINLDFADIRAVMSEMGKAMMGTGEAEGDNRAIIAAEAAISNPLLDNISMKGAKGILINITGGIDMTLFEIDAAANRIREEVDSNANIIFGSTFSEEPEDKRIRVSVLATGIDSEEFVHSRRNIGNVLKNEDRNTDSGSETNSGGFSDITTNSDFINRYLSNSTNNSETEDHNIAYYKPASIEESPVTDNQQPNIKSEQIRTQKSSLFNRVSEAMRNNKTTSITEDNDTKWGKESLLDIPAFLRKNK